MEDWEITLIFAKINCETMIKYTTINNPSPKLEELLHKIGVEKHERLERLKHETHFDKIIYINE